MHSQVFRLKEFESSFAPTVSGKAVMVVCKEGHWRKPVMRKRGTRRSCVECGCVLATAFTFSGEMLKEVHSWAAVFSFLRFLFSQRALLSSSCLGCWALFIFFSCCCDKLPWQKQFLGEKGFLLAHSYRLQSVVRQSRLQEPPLSTVSRSYRSTLCLQSTEEKNSRMHERAQLMFSTLVWSRTL